MNNCEFKKAVNAALYRVALSSPYASRAGTTSTGLSLHWETGEQALVWAIYARSVYDQLGINVQFGGFGPPCIPNDTHRSGEITLSNGKKRNVLEMLGITPAWALSQLKIAVNYTTMKEAA